MSTILLLEDNDSYREMICEALDISGYKVIQAVTGQQALECFEKEFFDLAILDVNIGEGLDGFDICRTIREDLYGSTVPIIFMTGDDCNENVLRSFREGGDDFIRKPCLIPELLARINALLIRSNRPNPTAELLSEGSIIQGEKDSYEIKKLIAAGGMGLVFEGVQQSNNKAVAIKTLKPNKVETKGDLKRFLREAKFTITFTHPNLAKGIEVVRTPNYFAFVMEYVKGVTLSTMVKKYKKIPVGAAIDVIEQITNGLDYLNQKGLVHRDIKPQNIVISDEGVAVLVDMGLSKTQQSGSTITSDNIIVGTPNYFSPEHISSTKTSILSDIYSLGLTFYFAITGKEAYGDGKQDTVEILKAKFSNEMDDPRKWAPEIPDKVCQIIFKMTDLKQEDRYQSPTELIKDLQEYRKK